MFPLREKKYEKINFSTIFLAVEENIIYFILFFFSFSKSRRNIVFAS